jgi:hypothetical protein
VNYGSSKKDRHHKSYHDAIKRTHRLSGANKVSVGKRNLHPKQVDSSHRSMFDCIDWYSRDHKKDHFNQVKSSVFDRLDWPAVESLDHQNLDSAIPLGPLGEQLQNSSCDECIIQKLNFHSKGKQPMNYTQDSYRIFICDKCSRAGLLNPPYHYWIKCHPCQQMGHVARHCVSKWKKVVNHQKPNYVPDSSVNNLSTICGEFGLPKLRMMVGTLEANDPSLKR